MNLEGKALFDKQKKPMVLKYISILFDIRRQTEVAAVSCLQNVVNDCWILKNHEQYIYILIFLFFNSDTYVEEESSQRDFANTKELLAVRSASGNQFQPKF